MNTEPSEDLLGRVRKLLAKAEDEGCPPAEAEALTAKAAELMARYGIDRARLGAVHPESDKPGDRVIDLNNPWADIKLHLLSGLASALRCHAIQPHRKGPGKRVHIFGYASDLERTDMLFTSVLVQMSRALAKEYPPVGNARAWRRSWMLGYNAAVVGRVRMAEEAAVTADSAAPTGDTDPSTALVLANRAEVVRRQVHQAYPKLRRTRVTYSGSGYGSGFVQGQRADIGGAKLRPRSTAALPRSQGQ
jgi:hypothetical protein